MPCLGSFAAEKVHRYDKDAVLLCMWPKSGVHSCRQDYTVHNAFGAVVEFACLCVWRSASAAVWFELMMKVTRPDCQMPCHMSDASDSSSSGEMWDFSVWLSNDQRIASSDLPVLFWDYEYWSSYPNVGDGWLRSYHLTKQMPPTKFSLVEVQLSRAA